MLSLFTLLFCLGHAAITVDEVTSASSTGPLPSVHETVFDAPIRQYLPSVGDQVVLTDANGVVHVSVDAGRSFVDITENFTENIQFATSAEADPSYIFLVGRSTTNHYSTDGGASFTQVEGTYSFVDIEYHPLEPNWLVGINESTGGSGYQAFVSADAGATWAIVSDYVWQANWRSDEEHGLPAATLYIVESGDDEVGHQLDDHDVYAANLNVYTSDSVTLAERDSAVLAESLESLRIVTRTYGFISSGRFTFLARTEDGSTVPRIYVSMDGLATAPAYAEIPYPFTPTSQVTFLSAENQMFVAVAEAFTNRGQLFESDAEGERYTLSLRNLQRLGTHSFAFFDPRGVEAVYLATVMDPDTSDLTSRITYNSGGAWQAIDGTRVTRAGQDEPCGDSPGCALQLRLSSPLEPVSSSISSGLLVAHGSIGERLSSSYADWHPMLSHDSGETWAEITTDPTFHLDITAHGSVLGMVPASGVTSTLVYSTDGGFTWTKWTDALSDEFRVNAVRAHLSAERPWLMLFLQPVGLYQGVVATIDFSPLDVPTCVGFDTPGANGSDYEEYEAPNPYGDGNGCVLGRRSTYVRRRPGARCIDSHASSAFPVRVVSCTCTRTDYSCVPGYEWLEESQTCVASTYAARTTEYDIIMASCFPEDDGVAQATYTLPIAYERVVGDSCAGGVDLTLPPAARACPDEPPTPPSTPAPPAPTDCSAAIAALDCPEAPLGCIAIDVRYDDDGCPTSCGALVRSTAQDVPCVDCPARPSSCPDVITHPCCSRNLEIDRETGCPMYPCGVVCDCRGPNCCSDGGSQPAWATCPPDSATCEASPVDGLCAWSLDKCQECGSRSGCEECVESPECAWCADTKVCSTYVASEARAVCPAGSLFAHSDDGAADDACRALAQDEADAAAADAAAADDDDGDGIGGGFIFLIVVLLLCCVAVVCFAEMHRRRRSATRSQRNALEYQTQHDVEATDEMESVTEEETDELEESVDDELTKDEVPVQQRAEGTRTRRSGRAGVASRSSRRLGGEA